MQPYPPYRPPGPPPRPPARRPRAKARVLKATVVFVFALFVSTSWLTFRLFDLHLGLLHHEVDTKATKAQTGD